MNGSVLNGSGAPHASPLSLPSAVAFGALFTALTLVGVCGNSLVILAISTDRKMRKSVMNLILWNLAVADLLNLLTCSAEWVQTIVLAGPGWVLPAVLCPAFRFVEVVFLYASLLSQLTVCVERFIAIVFPMKAHDLCTRRKIIGVICCLWTFALAFAIPYGIYHVARGGNCVWTRMPRFMLYKLAECLLFYFGPLAVSLVLYTKVSMVLWSKDKRLIESANDRRSENLRMRRNIVKMLVACVTVYFICYSPIQAIFVSRAIFRRSLLPNVYEVMLLLNALAFACSAANPLLYTLFSQRFRRRFGQLLCCRADDARFNATTAFAMSSAPAARRTADSLGPHARGRLHTHDATKSLLDAAEQRAPPRSSSSNTCRMDAIQGVGVALASNASDRSLDSR